ncbi:hypothetical protein LPW41_11705 [Microbacterium sp. JC 701]|uniref:hypothetical protein n=1 Tax=Microbacterium sp. JC 701 TaxID=2897389 RepID=UPI001E629998|nr:hypothetical protein [Microbacterium sp. JC 701]MCD2170362.1 hypothetical protein [Microbacterium sp. JC 701]
MGDLEKTFAADPAGWISVGLAIAAIIFSAIFWRRLWAVIRAAWRVLRTMARAVGRLRITTESQIKPKNMLVIPPRWSISTSKDRRDDDEYVLVNWSHGSAARNVRLDAGLGASLRSAAVWPSIDGPGTGTFRMVIVDETALWAGIDFSVVWYDERGERHWEEVSIGGH